MLCHSSPHILHCYDLIFTFTYYVCVLMPYSITSMVTIWPNCFFCVCRCEFYQCDKQSVRPGRQQCFIGDRIVTFVMMRSNLSEELEFGHFLSDIVMEWYVTICYYVVVSVAHILRIIPWIVCSLC